MNLKPRADGVQPPVTKRRIVAVYSPAILLNLLLSLGGILLAIDGRAILSLPLWAASTAEIFLFNRWSMRNKFHERGAEPVAPARSEENKRPVQAPLTRRRIVAVYSAALLLNWLLLLGAAILLVDGHALLSLPVWAAFMVESFVFVRWSARNKVQARWAELRRNPR
jgi:hypothetical protein